MLPVKEKCNRAITFQARPHEYDFLSGEAKAEGKPLAAYLRERLGLENATAGRRWPTDPADRSWRKTG
jgi:hypothetical protein